MLSRTTAILVAMVSAALVANAATAITILNPSFEAPSTADGTTDAPITDWTATGTAGVFNPEAGFFTVPIDGSQTAYRNGTGTISQVLTATFAANTTYVLEVDVLSRLSSVEPCASVAAGICGTVLATDYVIQIAYNGGMVLASASEQVLDGSKQSVKVEHTTNGGPEVNQQIEIWLVNLDSTRQVNYDNVTLVPEPSTALLTALGMLALGYGTRRRHH